MGRISDLFVSGVYLLGITIGFLGIGAGTSIYFINKTNDKKIHILEKERIRNFLATGSMRPVLPEGRINSEDFDKAVPQYMQKLKTEILSQEKIRPIVSTLSEKGREIAPVIASLDEKVREIELPDLDSPHRIEDYFFKEEGEKNRVSLDEINYVARDMGFFLGFSNRSSAEKIEDKKNPIFFKEILESERNSGVLNLENSLLKNLGIATYEVKSAYDDYAYGRTSIKTFMILEEYILESSAREKAIKKSIDAKGINLRRITLLKDNKVILFGTYGHAPDENPFEGSAEGTDISWANAIAEYINRTDARAVIDGEIINKSQTKNFVEYLLSLKEQ